MKKLLSDVPTELLQKFISLDLKTSLYVSGGCTSILGWLTLLPGSSKNVAETRNPYMKDALSDLLGYAPEKFVDVSVSRNLALKAFTNTQKYMYLDAENDLYFRQQQILGVGITGSLKSSYQKKGLHHVYLSLIDQKKYVTYYIVLDKDKRTRQEEDYFIGHNVLNIINNLNAGISQQLTLIGDPFAEDKITIFESMDTVDLLLDNLDKQIMNIIFLPEGKILANQILSKSIVIPGSFNPIHDGHIALGNAVADKFGFKKSHIIFELSDINADKGKISREELDKRIKLINEKGFVAMLTRKPFFYSKNEYLRQGAFVVGADTFKRIINAKYYNDSKEIMSLRLSEFSKYENLLIVAPRLNPQTNELEVLGDFEIPEIIKNLTHELEQFRVDVSSTEIRQKMQEKEEQSNKPPILPTK